MAVQTISPEVVVSQALGVLEREVVLPNFVTRIPGTKFVGAKDDTVTLRVPSFATARTRTMRSATGLTIDGLEETKVDVTLDTHIYRAVGVTDEDLTLSVQDFGSQITAPATGSVVRGIEDLLAAAMEGETYETDLTIESSDPYQTIVAARAALNKASVPMGSRFLAVGADVESDVLLSDRLSKFDLSGSSDTLREAVMGRIAGFTALSVPGLDPGTMIAGHSSAFVLPLQAPVVPAGVAWGAVNSFAGYALRVLRDYLPDGSTGPADRFLADVFAGASAVKDNGSLDGDGKFVPDPDAPAILVRAVRCTLSGS
jgi:hypothetical protein